MHKDERDLLSRLFCIASPYTGNKVRIYNPVNRSMPHKYLINKRSIQLLRAAPQKPAGAHTRQRDSQGGLLIHEVRSGGRDVTCWIKPSEHQSSNYTETSLPIRNQPYKGLLQRLHKIQVFERKQALNMHLSCLYSPVFST